MSLAADGQDWNGLRLDKKAKLFKLFPFALDVQRQRYAWVKLPSTNFRTVWTKHLRNPRDVAPVKAPSNGSRDFARQTYTNMKLSLKCSSGHLYSGSTIRGEITKFSVSY